MIHFYSDPHFGHKMLIERNMRPFTDIYEMTDKLIENYNKKVSPDDVTYWLGDCFFIGKMEMRKKIMDSLNGQKILIIGNHDDRPSKMIACGFSAVFNTATMRVAKRNVQLCHYPYYPKWWGRWKVPKHALRFPERRPKKMPGWWLLHGHIHSSQKVHKESKSINCCVEAWDYAPASIRDIEHLIQTYDR